MSWAVDSGKLTKSSKFAILAGDRAGDQLAVEKYLVPALKAHGLDPTLTATITANLDDPSTAVSQAKSIVSQLKSKGVDTVIPLLPVYPPFQSYVSAAHAQDYHPTLLLSDYEQTVNVALGLAESLYPKEVSGQEGPTVYTFGNEDDPRPDPPLQDYDGPGYTPEAKACWQTYQKYNPKRLSKFPYIESQGPTMRWCDTINVIKQAMQNAGKNLNRRTFIKGLSEIKNFPVALTQAITFGPNDFSGPATFRVVKPTANVQTAAGNVCPRRRMAWDDTPGDPKIPYHGSCWLIPDGPDSWKPLNTK